MDRKTHGVGASGTKRKRSLEPDSTFPAVHKKMKKILARKKRDKGSTSTHFPATIHTAVSDVEGKTQPQRQMFNVSQLYRPNRKTSSGQRDRSPCEDSLRPMPSSIPSPLLCDQSLRTLYNDPCKQLARDSGLSRRSPRMKTPFWMAQTSK